MLGLRRLWWRVLGRRQPGLRGRQPAKRVDLPFLHDGRKALPPAYDVSHGFTAWGMLGNGPDRTLTLNGGQPVGDCAWAAIQHGLMVKALVQKEDGSWGFRPDFKPPTSDETVGLYFGYEVGNPPGQPATSGPDNGTCLADGLAWACKGGIIKRYGPVDPTNKAAVHQALIEHKGLLVGVNLDAAAEAEFARHLPWRELHDPTVGGHAIYQIAYSLHLDTFVTWGADQLATFDWDSDQVEEVWWFQAPWEPDTTSFRGYDKKLQAVLK